VFVRPLGLVLLLLALAGLPGATRAQDAVEVDVDVEGVEKAHKKNVLGHLSIARAADAGPLSPAEVGRLDARAAAEVRTALEPFGFYDAAATSTIERGRKRWKVRYHVVPGEAVRIDTLVVEMLGDGAHDAAFGKTLAASKLEVGRVFVHAHYEEVKIGLVRAAAKSGYLDGRYLERRATVYAEPRTATLVLRYDTGRRYRLGDVRFQQDFMDSAFLARMVPFAAGDEFDADTLLQLQNRLGRSPYFHSVQVQPRKDLAVDRVIPVEVQLEPARFLKYTLGGGYGTTTGAEVTLGFEFRRLNRHGHHANVDLALGQIESSANATYSVPFYSGRRHDVLSGFGGYFVEKTDVAESRRRMVGVGWSRQVDILQQTLKLTLERQTFTVGVDEGEPTLLSPEYNLTLARGDDAVTPRRGFAVRGAIGGSSEDLLSDVTYAQLTAGGKIIAPMWWRTRLLARAMAGRVWGDDFRSLPPNLRYFFGGPETVRGYDYQSLAPRDELDNVIGGPIGMGFSLEVEQLLAGGLGVAGFFDYGNAVDKLGDPLKGGMGAGLRWRSPVGMVRIDAAVPSDRPDARLNWSLSIGPDL
jgi:translocation and assembly module TamA